LPSRRKGGIGIVHKNMPPAKQPPRCLKVKRTKPVSCATDHDHEDMTVRDAIDLQRSNKISGLPVSRASASSGIVTTRDLRFETRYEAPISEIMTRASGSSRRGSGEPRRGQGTDAQDRWSGCW